MATWFSDKKAAALPVPFTARFQTWSYGCMFHDLMVEWFSDMIIGKVPRPSGWNVSLTMWLHFPWPNGWMVGSLTWWLEWFPDLMVEMVHSRHMAAWFPGVEMLPWPDWLHGTVIWCLDGSLTWWLKSFPDLLVAWYRDLMPGWLPDLLVAWYRDLMPGWLPDLIILVCMPGHKFCRAVGQQLVLLDDDIAHWPN